MLKLQVGIGSQAGSGPLCIICLLFYPSFSEERTVCTDGHSQSCELTTDSPFYASRDIIRVGLPSLGKGRQLACRSPGAAGKVCRSVLHCSQPVLRNHDCGKKSFGETSKPWPPGHLQRVYFSPVGILSMGCSSPSTLPVLA